MRGQAHRGGPGSLHVLVMAKAPVPGTVKTRLCPPCTTEEAAAIAEAALADTLHAVAACDADFKVVALDGPPGPWLPSGIDVIAQREGRFDERLANAWADIRPATGGWGVQIGMDTPQITAGLLDAQLAVLRSGAAGANRRPTGLVGRATDGGWWMIGLPGTDPRLVFRGIPMSTPHTGAAQARRLRALGLNVASAPELRDIDTVDDLRAVTAAIPDSRVGTAGRAVLARIAGPTSAERVAS
jgi:glycosyltransferase A (GT-A) superfamily protein (DUF2064 family)